MGFTSIYFLLFLALLFPTYFLFPKRHRWIVLLIFSVVFFVLVSWKSIFFILFSSISIYLFSRGITKNKQKEKLFLEQNIEITSDEKKVLKKKNKKTRKTLLVFGILSVLAVLVVMKYLDFLTSNLNTIFGWFGSDFKINRLNLFLPLGISFYTFQSIGYITDVYWNKYEAEENIFKFFLFMSFFPKIM